MTTPLVLAVPSKGRLQENADAFFATEGQKLVFQITSDEGIVSLQGNKARPIISARKADRFHQMSRGPV